MTSYRFRACCLLLALAGCASRPPPAGSGFDRQAALAQCERERMAGPAAAPDDCARQVETQAQDAAALAGVDGDTGGGRQNNSGPAPAGRHGGGGFGMGTGFGRGAAFGTPGAEPPSATGTGTGTGTGIGTGIGTP